MINNINRFRRISPERKDVTRRSRYASDLPLDHRLTFSTARDEHWTFDERERRIYFNDEDVAGVISECRNDISFLCGCSHALYAYQQFVWSRGGKGNAEFNGVVTSLQDVIHGHLSNIYDDLTGGVHFECDGGDFWLNNINVSSVLKLYMLRPTERGRIYLMGLRDKLGLILSRQQSSTRYDGIHEQAKHLMDEITMVLKFSPAGAGCRLLAGHGGA